MNAKATKLIDVCESNFDEFKADCSGFVKAVIRDISDVILHGNADDLVDFLKQSGDWTALPDGDGQAAKEKAEDGWVVIGGMMKNELTPARSHGHVVIVVAGDADAAICKYPPAYWGMFGGVGAKNKTLNYSFNRTDRDRVHYYAIEI